MEWLVTTAQKIIDSSRYNKTLRVQDSGEFTCVDTIYYASYANHTTVGQAECAGTGRVKKIQCAALFPRTDCKNNNVNEKAVKSLNEHFFSVHAKVAKGEG